jgi:hypothetical protein
MHSIILVILCARHLAETQPHNDQKLQDWDTPNQEQINKLKAESQKTKPQLANHDLFLVWGVPVLEFLVVVRLGFSQMSGIHIYRHLRISVVE